MMKAKNVVQPAYAIQAIKLDMDVTGIHCVMNITGFKYNVYTISTSLETPRVDCCVGLYRFLR